MIREIAETDLITFLRKVAPEQANIVEGSYFDHGINLAFGWVEEDELVGCIRYCLQEIGLEQKTPPIMQNGKRLTEAKINAFAVREDHRNKGTGKQLQLWVIEDAKVRGCSQVASYSTYDKHANYAVKLRLGFCIQPETQPNGMKGCYFLKKLN